MADVFSRKKRSWVMSRIRYKNTRIEVRLRKLLWARGLRYRINYGKLPSKPDLAFQSSKVVVFIDGCFWHKCPKCFVRPKTRTVFWTRKIEGNVIRDKITRNRLKRKGWKVIRFWEHTLKKNQVHAVEKIIYLLKSIKG